MTRGREAIDLNFRKCVGNQCNYQSCDGGAPANCESLLVTGFDAFFRSELTEGVGTRRALQPSAFSECRKINSTWGIPSTRAIAGAKLQSDILVAIRNPQRRTCNRIWLRGSQWSRRGVRFAFPRPLRRRRYRSQLFPAASARYSFSRHIRAREPRCDPRPAPPAQGSLKRTSGLLRAAMSPKGHHY